MKQLSAALIIQNSPVEQFDTNLTQTLHLVDQAADAGAKLAVFPEASLTGYGAGEKIKAVSRCITPDILQPLRRAAQKQDITILAGLFEKTQHHIYAAHLIFSPDGSVGKYRKIHTAPMETGHLTPGDEIPVFVSNGFTFGVQLCYDAHFPELSTRMALDGADVIFICHASPRGSCEEKYESWLRHLRARAFDNGVYVAALNQAGDNQSGLKFPGVSLLIGPDGHVASRRFSRDRHCIHMICLDKERLEAVRNHPMRYFLTNRRDDVFDLQSNRP